jgi:nitroimidazol reductase NimA-like FMN-containing flavoprotein (pyridoxamine 5'-phosphate oxidase superfamily)/GNAT superfamily N-acetyltransferase
MSEAVSASPSSRTVLHRHAERGSFDPALIHTVLDECLLCHVGVATAEGPVVLPMGFVRMGEAMVLHGAVSNRILAAVAGGATACVTVTALDGLVLARSALRHSMNFRSVVVFGKGRTLATREEKRAALDAMIDRYAASRARTLRPSTEAELDATLVVAIPLGEASAKVRTGPPLDLPADLGANVWAGVVPLRAAWGAAVPVDELASRQALPELGATRGVGAVARLGSEAVEEGVALANGVGWNELPGDWLELMSSGQLFGRRGSDGRLVATGLVCDFDTAAPISKIVVRADWRRRGLARTFMEACLKAIPSGRIPWLTAMPEARPLYEQLGFAVVANHHIFSGEPRLSRVVGAAVREIRDEDWPKVLALDRQASGCQRAAYLAMRRARAHAAVLVEGPGGTVAGYALAVEKKNLLFVGPITARSEEFAMALFHGVTARWHGQVRLDVPVHQAGLAKALIESGLTVTALRPEMTLGGAPLPADQSLRFALSSAAAL